MDNIKNDQYYLKKIISDVEFIINHTIGKTLNEIERNEILVDSIMFRLIQISENNDKLSKEYKESHTDISWKAIKGMRNKIVHDYGVVDISIIYDTVMNSIPDLYKKIKDYI